MSHTIPPAPAERFARLIAALCEAVAARLDRPGLPGPLIILIWSRLRGISAGFAALAARIAAGQVRRIPVRRRPRATARRVSPSPLPRSPAWLLRLVPAAAAYGSQLQYLLAEPEMAALVAAAPQMRRLLRPLCRMLGVRLPPPPASAAAPAPAPATSAPAAPAAPRRVASPRQSRPKPAPPTRIRPHPPPVAA